MGEGVIMKKRTATMSDVAKIAGVSQSTVSMIMSNKQSKSFPQDTVIKVYAAANELGYKIRKAEKPDSKSKIILVVTSNLNNSYYTTMIHAIEKIAMDTEFTIIICNTYHNVERENKYMSLVISRQYEGIIFLYPPDNREMFHTLATTLPAIAICDRDSQVDADIVELDNERSGELVAEHLIQLGHRKIGFLTDAYENNITRAMRLKGVQSKMKDYGIENELTILVAGDQPTDGIKTTNLPYTTGYALAKRDEIYEKNLTALVCINDLVALGAIDALCEKKLKIPDDISIVGFDNLNLSAMRPISLTTIDNHMGFIAKSAMELLINRIRDRDRNKTAPENEVDNTWQGKFKFEFEPDLVIRNSTGKPKDK